MDAGEMITFCALKGNVTLHKQLQDADGFPTQFYVIRLEYSNNVVQFQYFKHDDNTVSFSKGTKSESDQYLGILLSHIASFDELLEYLKL